MNLTGTVALITGSSSGIGSATAKALAAHGCNVAVTWRSDENGGKETAKACEALGAKTLRLQLDVAKDDSCRSAVEKIVSEWGRLDILVNNAGTTKFCEHTNLEGLSAKDFLDIYQVNVVGAYQMCRAAAPHLMKRSVAHIVNVSSMAALSGRGSSIAYAASKGALSTMTKSLARALGPVVRVNAVSPGLVHGSWVEEGLGKDAYQKTMRTAEMRSALKAMPTPDHVAGAILAYVGGCDMVTGDNMLIDGGAHLGTAALQPTDRK